MKNEVLYGALHTLVEVIDWTPINEKISKTVGFDVECRLGNGFLRDVTAIFEKDGWYQGREMTRNIIIDKECCGRSAKSGMYFVGDLKDDPFQINLFDEVEFYKVLEKKEDGTRSISMFPSFLFNIDEDDVKACLTGEKIPLYLFMQSRYAYNPRVRSNEREILELVFHKDPNIELHDGDVVTKTKWNAKIEMEWDLD